MVSRLVNRVSAVGLALVAAMMLAAAPAGADHVAEITADGSWCKLGELANSRGGLGFDLITDRATIEIDPATGDLVYSCRFDVPSYVPAADRSYPFVGTEDWYLPTRAIKFGGFTCWAPGVRLPPPTEHVTHDSRMVVTPSGVGIMTCTFRALAPPDNG